MKKSKDTFELIVKFQNGAFSYEKMFLQERYLDHRGDKSIYIRAEYHERLARIVRVIGEDRIPLYVFLDNILTYHFDVFEEILIKEFEAKTKPLF